MRPDENKKDLDLAGTPPCAHASQPPQFLLQRSNRSLKLDNALVDVVGHAEMIADYTGEVDNLRGGPKTREAMNPREGLHYPGNDRWARSRAAELPSHRTANTPILTIHTNARNTYGRRSGGIAATRSAAGRGPFAVTSKTARISSSVGSKNLAKSTIASWR